VRQANSLPRIAASRTGQILVTFERKLWVYTITSRQKNGNWNWGWKQESLGEMDSVSEEAIAGFDVFRANLATGDSK